MSSVIFPDGTIIQTCRGVSSCFASAPSVFAVDVDVRVVRLHVVPGLLQPLRHPRAHPAEADHSQLH